MKRVLEEEGIVFMRPTDRAGGNNQPFCAQRLICFLSSIISWSRKCFHFSPDPCCTSTVLPPNEMKKQKSQKESGLMGTETNLVSSQITRFVQSDVSIFWFFSLVKQIPPLSKMETLSSV